MKSLRLLLPALMFIAVSGIASAQTVGVSPNPAIVNEPVVVSWTAPSPGATDWIGLYAVGDPNEDYIEAFYTGGTTSGSSPQYAPSTPGTYEYRYLINDSYTSTATSGPFVVTAATGFSVSITPSSAAPGNPLTVSWTAPAGRPANDWIGIYAQGETENRNYDWERWIYTGGATSGSFVTTMPNYGPIVARYLLRDSYVHVAESNVVGTTYSVSASPTTVAQGGQITATWTAPLGTSATDWIGLFKVGTAAHTWYSYVYTGGSTNGFAIFTAPNDPGLYEFRYYLNDGSGLAATSQTITIL